jgi:hypothetical protein
VLCQYASRAVVTKGQYRVRPGEQEIEKIPELLDVAFWRLDVWDTSDAGYQYRCADFRPCLRAHIDRRAGNAIRNPEIEKHTATDDDEIVLVRQIGKAVIKIPAVLQRIRFVRLPHFEPGDLVSVRKETGQDGVETDVTRVVADVSDEGRYMKYFQRVPHIAASRAFSRVISAYRT